MSSPAAAPHSRSSLGRVTIGSLAVIALIAGAFLIGRATASDSKSAAGASTPPTKAAGTTTTVPTLAIGEALESQPDKPLDNATRAALAADLVAARAVAARYPTVADARAAGLIQAGGFAPGSGAHFLDMKHTNNIRPDGSVDPNNPLGYIYDGTSPGSRIVGLMYVSLAENPPAGFPGPNDHWHQHSNLCIKYGANGIAVPFPPDRDVTRAQCNTVPGSTFMKKTVWMVHAWVVPGWESPKGVFSHSNPDVTCADGTMHTDAVGFCKGT
jgi:hypothetical protein